MRLVGTRRSYDQQRRRSRAVRSSPDRFVGVASVDLMRPMAAVAELRRWVEEFGFRALRVRDLGQARQRGRCRNGALAMTQAT